MFYLIIASLLTLPHETTTKFEYFNWPLTFENEKIQDLNRKGNLIEKVWYGNVHAYSRRKVNNKSFEEYYRINDTLFHYKKVVDSLIVDKGYFKINKKEIFTSDTIYIACRYGEWEDIIQIHHFHQPVKIKYWRSNPSKSETIKGRYIDG
ncbi:MAG: hypothetical protein P1U56_26780, partial [Saprospiraceae bacterium]|nr:hypothetical protein [Saprospiraceae bacterium]